MWAEVARHGGDVDHWQDAFSPGHSFPCAEQWAEMQIPDVLSVANSMHFRQLCEI